MNIGVVLLIEGNETLGMPRYRDVRTLALQAEAAGIASIWLYDHLLFRFGETTIGHWECFTFLAALAEATERIALGVLVTCTAFRNPALIAKIATAMDEVSEGRFTLGLGAGWNEVEFRAFGLPFDQRVARFEEALQIIVPLLRGGHVDFGGAHYWAPDCANLPRGPSPHGPPILVGAFGPRMLRLAARYAEAVNTSVDRLALSAACTEVGRDPATLALTLPAWAAFPDLGPTPDHMRESTYTSAEELAEFLRALAQAGAAHVMIDFRPNTPAALARVVEALQLYHNNDMSKSSGSPQ